MGTIGLSMIVKNESHIIRETLENICSYISFDYWVICDTGSTDNTPDIIKDFFDEKGIKGELLFDTWINFGVNRTKALQYAKDKTDYLFIFDADDKIHGNFIMPPLEKDGYECKFGKNFTYFRPLVINNKLNWSFKGVLHEYLNCENNVEYEKIQGDYYIESGKTGFRNKNPLKYQNDAKILINAYYQLPDNDNLKKRYAFYIGQSFKDAKMYDEAIMWYKNKIKIGGWDEEVYMSYYYICEIYKYLNKPKTLKKYAIDGHQYLKGKRIETMYLLITFLIENGEFDDAYKFYSHCSIDKNIEGLFIHKDIYLWKMEFQGSILMYYVDEFDKGFELSMKLLQENILPIDYYQSVLRNLKFYVDKKNYNFDSAFLFQQNHQFLDKDALDVIDTLIVMNQENFGDFRHIPIQFSNDGEIYCFITTCKRYALFEKTLNSFLNHCEDIHLISKFICIDDNSSYKDREKMSKKFPFLQFIFKDEQEKGHGKTMNLIYKIVRKEKPKYVLHLEDDWLFFKSDKYITKMKNILEKTDLSQILFNQCYAETYGDLYIKGYIDKKFYVEHLYIPDKEEWRKYSFENGSNSAYWPHFSLRPSMYQSNIYQILDEFKEEGFFEKEFAERYVEKDCKSGFLKGICCRHIGKCTKEDGENAYLLNGMNQF